MPESHTPTTVTSEMIRRVRFSVPRTSVPMYQAVMSAGRTLTSLTSALMMWDPALPADEDQDEGRQQDPDGRPQQRPTAEALGQPHGEREQRHGDVRIQSATTCRIWAKVWTVDS